MLPLLILVLICQTSADIQGSQRTPLFHRNTSGHVVPWNDGLRAEDAWGHWVCSSASDCDYAGCSDRDHAWGCWVGGWANCYFVAKQSDPDHCITSCTGAPFGYGDEYWSTFCPVPPAAALCDNSDCKFYVFSGVLMLSKAECARNFCRGTVDLHSKGIISLVSGLLSGFVRLTALWVYLCQSFDIKLIEWNMQTTHLCLQESGWQSAGQSCSWCICKSFISSVFVRAPICNFKAAVPRITGIFVMHTDTLQAP